MKLVENLSHYWNLLQGNLFPALEEAMGNLSEKQQQLVTVLEF